MKAGGYTKTTWIVVLSLQKNDNGPFQDHLNTTETAFPVHSHIVVVELFCSASGSSVVHTDDTSLLSHAVRPLESETAVQY